MSRLIIAAVSLAAWGLVSGAPVAGAEDAGEAVFKKNCFICHTVEAGKNKVGPSLNGIVGRKAGTVPGFSYTSANKNSGVTWDEATLDTYITDPRKFIPGTKMTFPGLKDAHDPKPLIDFLTNHHPNTPLPPSLFPHPRLSTP